jgi:hypothetical protein
LKNLVITNLLKTKNFKLKIAVGLIIAPIKADSPLPGYSL